MKVKSFFMIVVRIIGLFMLINMFKQLPFIISQLSSMATMAQWSAMFDKEVNTEIVPIVTFSVVFAILLFLIVYFLLMRPGKLINILQLDTGFEEEKFELHFSNSTILRISIIVIGGVVLLYEFPRFVHEIFFLWQAKQIKWIENPGMKDFIFSSVVIVISYFLIYYNKKIVEYIEKKTADEVEIKI